MISLKQMPYIIINIHHLWKGTFINLINQSIDFNEVEVTFNETNSVVLNYLDMMSNKFWVIDGLNMYLF